MPDTVWISTKRRRAVSAAAVLGMAGFIAAAQPSMAAAPADVLERLRALEDLIDTQQRQLEAQQREIDSGRAEINALKEQLKVSEPTVAEAPRPPTPPEPRAAQAAASRSPEPEVAEAAFQRGRPTLRSRDRRYSLSVLGRLQFDAAGYFQDEAGPLSTDWRRGSIGGGRENIAATDLSSGSNFRRAQLGIEGELGRHFGYRLLPEFGGTGEETNPRMHEAWLSYTSLTPWTIKLGAFAPPANLDDSSGADETPFLERATPAQLSRALAGSDGRVSAGLTGNRQRWFAAFHFTGSTFSGDESFDEQIAVVGRAAVLAFTGSDFNVHLGVNGSYVMQPANTGGGATSARYIRFRDQPELRVDSTRLIDTGQILAENAYAAGVEFAANWKSLMVQAEAFQYGIGLANDSPNPNPQFSAWYAEASYVLAGERRPYDMATGSYAAPRPITAPDGAALRGALELAVRYSHTDLDFHAGSPGSPPPPGGIRGGVQNNWSVGLNWYPTPNTKLMFDYQHISVDRLNPASASDPEPFGSGDATPPIGVQIGQRLHALAVRTQYSF
jgi:phosphate-selective porin OprO/OprP